MEARWFRSPCSIRLAAAFSARIGFRMVWANTRASSRAVSPAMRTASQSEGFTQVIKFVSGDPALNETADDPWPVSRKFVGLYSVDGLGQTPDILIGPCRGETGI